MIGEDLILSNQVVLNEISEFNTFLGSNFISSPSPNGGHVSPSYSEQDEAESPSKQQQQQQQQVFHPNVSTTSSSTSDDDGGGSIEVFLNSLDGDVYKDLLQKKEKDIDELKNQNQFRVLWNYSRIRIALGVTNTRIRKTRVKVEGMKSQLAKVRKRNTVLSRRILFQENQNRRKLDRNYSDDDEEFSHRQWKTCTKGSVGRRRNRRISLQPSFPVFRDEVTDSPKKRKRMKSRGSTSVGSSRRRRRKTTNHIFEKKSNRHSVFRSMERRSSDETQLSWQDELKKYRGDEVCELVKMNRKEREEIRRIKLELESLRRSDRYFEEKKQITIACNEEEKKRLRRKLGQLKNDLKMFDKKILDFEKTKDQNSFLSLEKEVFEHIM